MIDEKAKAIGTAIFNILMLTVAVVGIGFSINWPTAAAAAVTAAGVVALALYLKD